MTAVYTLTSPPITSRSTALSNRMKSVADTS